MIQTLWKAASQFLSKLNTQLPHDPATVYSRTFSPEQRRLMSTHETAGMFTATLFAIAPNWKPLRCPSAGEQSVQQWSIHTQHGTQLARKGGEPWTQPERGSISRGMWEMPTPEVYMPLGSTHSTFLRGHLHRHGRRIGGCQLRAGSGEGVWGSMRCQHVLRLGRNCSVSCG